MIIGLLHGRLELRLLGVGEGQSLDVILSILPVKANGTW
jgi:hypothetical protein